ncbi:MAG: type II toxin-antitoxin system ParD family antitoxin [Alphaproteobacteria bacterium]|nr:type II toxin-antitoxin system ParD family antitoxin [Alphaproteobacteria bacterium]
MSGIERLTITLPAEMAASVKEAVEGGDYASSSEVIREALRAWKIRRAVQMQELAALRADLQKGLDDIAAGRTEPFSAERIIERGKQLSRKRSKST